MKQIYQVTCKLRKTGEIVTVPITIEQDHFDQTKYSATNLEYFGCGKTATTPNHAIRQLIQDMATILDVSPTEAERK